MQLPADGPKDTLKQPSIYLDSSQHHKIIFDANDTQPVEQNAADQGVCPLDQPIEQQAKSEYSDDIGSPEKEEIDDISASSDSHDSGPQPWELVGDRFAPIRIEQVSLHFHTTVLEMVGKNCSGHYLNAYSMSRKNIVWLSYIISSILTQYDHNNVCMYHVDSSHQ